MKMESVKLEVKLSNGNILKFTIFDLAGEIVNLPDEFATISLSGTIAEYEFDGSEINDSIPNIRMIRL